MKKKKKEDKTKQKKKKAILAGDCGRINYLLGYRDICKESSCKYQKIKQTGRISFRIESFYTVIKLKQKVKAHKVE